MISISDIRNGLAFRHKGEIYTVVSFQQVKQARSAGFYRVKMKSIKSGKTIDDTFNSNVKLDDIRVERRTYQYSFDEGANLVFMDTNTWEQIPIAKERISDTDLLIEGESVDVLFNTADDTIMTVELPQNVIRVIEYTEPGIKGDTATNTLKPAKVEGGAEIKVPLFVNTGDKIKIDTATRKYVERAK
ncbi:MAG: elongation factor P [Bacteroidia bacterium]